MELPGNALICSLSFVELEFSLMISIRLLQQTLTYLGSLHIRRDSHPRAGCGKAERNVGFLCHSEGSELRLWLEKCHSS